MPTSYTDQYTSEFWSYQLPNGNLLNHGSTDGGAVYGPKPVLIVSDSRRPKVRNARINGWRSPSPYWRTVEFGEIWGPTVSYRAEYPSGYGSFLNVVVATGWPTSWNTGAGYIPISLPSYDRQRAQCELQALKRLKDQKVNLGVAFGERAETAELIAHSLGRIVRGIKAAKHLDVKGLAKALALDTSRVGKLKNVKKPFELWLEAQYGWMPLLSDVHGATTVLKERDSADPTRYIVSVHSKAQEKFQEVNGPYAWASNTSGAFLDLYNRRDIIDACRVSLHYYLDNPALAEFASVGVTNPLDVAWELLPFSFVADWFLPIGDYINVLDSTLGYIFKGGTATGVRRISGKWFTTGTPAGFNGTASYSLSSGSYRQFKMSRDVYDGSPTPDLFQLGSWGNLHGYRLNNAISLVGANLKSLRRLFR